MLLIELINKKDQQGFIVFSSRMFIQYSIRYTLKNFKFLNLGADM